MKRRKLPEGIYWRDGSLHIRIKTSGRDYRESTRQTSVEFAKQMLAKRKTELAESKVFPARRFERVKFGELLEAWWKTVPGVPHQKLGKKTASGFEYLLPRVRARFASVPARNMTSAMIRGWLGSLTDEDGNALGASSRNHFRTIINLAFNSALADGRYDRNPIFGELNRPRNSRAAVPQFKEPEGREVLASADSIQALLAELEEDWEVYVAVVALTVLNLRKNELLARKWSDLQLEGESPRILVPTTKNGRPKNIPLSPLLIPILKKLPSFGREEFVFPSRPTARAPKPNRPYRWDIGKQFRAAAKVVGLTGVHVHDLKHIAPSILLSRGVEEGIVRKITGHRSRELWRYQHLMPDLRKTTVNLVAEELLKERD